MKPLEIGIKLEKAAVLSKKEINATGEREIAITHTANILGRTFEDVREVYNTFSTKKNPERFLKIIYWLGNLAINEIIKNQKRTITFSPVLRERLGHHIHGEIWANNIKKTLKAHNLLQRPIHIISANMHSVMNSLFATKLLAKQLKTEDPFDIYEHISNSDRIRAKVEKEALSNGMIYIEDDSGTNINVQIFDTAKIKSGKSSFNLNNTLKEDEKPVLFVMDYAFGEQAYETIDEFLKPFNRGDKREFLNIASISIMGKAGILEGGKGDIMIPSAHIFEGTADNYPFKNELDINQFKGHGLEVLRVQ